MRHISGRTAPAVVRNVTTRGDKDACVVEVIGNLSDLKTLQNSNDGMKALCPAGMEIENSSCTPDGSGNGTLSIRCVAYGSADVSTAPTRITYRIDLIEVRTDLKNHPTVADARLTIEKWLATDAVKRFDAEGNPQYVDESGNETAITDEKAKKFCAAYSKGIESYNRYFPVIEKISYMKRVPGLSMLGNSLTGGTAEFSNAIGKWDRPSISLSGYADAGWFKSKDSYSQSNDLVWTRSEQWTWSPDYDDDDVKWIYDRTQGGGQGGGS